MEGDGMLRLKGRFAALLAALFLLGALLPAGESVPTFSAEQAGAAAEEETGGKAIPILMYHRVSTDRAALGKFVVTPRELEEDLQYLQAHGYETVTMSDLVDYVYHGGALPEKPVVLTFDDGYFSDYRHVLPLLKQYGVRAVFSVIGTVTDQYSAEGRADIHYPHLIWSQIREMAESGLAEFQNHSYDLHHDGVGAGRRKGESDETYRARIAADLSRWQVRFPEEGIETPNTFTYPYGNIGKGSQAILRELGFLASLSCYERVDVLTRDNPDCLFQLGRVIRPHGPSSEAVFGKIQGLTVGGARAAGGENGNII